MRQPVLGLAMGFGLWVVAVLPAPCAENVGVESLNPSLNPSLMSVEGLEARIAQTDLDPDLDAAAKAQVVARYREAVSNLKEAEVNRSRAAAFEEVTRAAPEETRRIRERMSAAGAADASQALDVGLETARGEIELRLRKARADLAAAQARQADFERRRSFHENRPAMIRQRLTAAQEQQDAIASALMVDPGVAQRSPLTEAGTPALTQSLMQARWWAMETRYVALSTEVRALEQELLSLPMRLDLLAARRDQETVTVERLGVQVEALKDLLNDKHVIEAAQAKAEATDLLNATAGLDPLLVHLARQNAELTDQLSEAVGRLDDQDDEEAEAIRSTERIKADFERVQAAREISGLTEGIGTLLLEHRAALPDFEVLDRKLQALAEQIASVNVSRVRHLDEATRIADSDLTLAELRDKLASGYGQETLDMLRTLLAARQALLAKQVEAEGEQLNGLRRLKAAEGRMLEAARAYDYFLEEHLFWLGTGHKTRPGDFARLDQDMRLLAAPALWSELRRSFSVRLATSPLYWLTLLAGATLLWKRRTLIEAIGLTSARIGRPGGADSGQMLRALMLTLIVAAPLPLMLGATGWLLQDAPNGTAVSDDVGSRLVRIAMVFYALSTLRDIGLPSGLAIGHFRWPTPEVRRLRFELGWLMWVLAPALFLGAVALSANPEALGGLVQRLVALVAVTGTALFFFRLFHPKTGLVARQRRRGDPRLLYRAYPLWYPLLVAFPPVVMVLSWDGYVYSAHVLWGGYVLTLGLIAALAVAHALAWSWLTLANRRLAQRVARERRDNAIAERAAVADGELSGAPSEYAHVDLDAASAAGRELLGMAVVVLALVGLYAIWSPIFPALSVLDEVTLWHTARILDGEEATLPVTLADLGLALVYLVGIVVLAKRLPAMLEIILAERLRMTASGRYTVTTLTTYVIVAIGLVLALDRVGAQWSQLQWLVAALGVGIGFGLQEIVANFVSGLIILFERPVRVGDVITVDGTDGVVTKIRIRATTIRGYDRKELLVPNKELITGRLLNWSLSDSVTRILILVGVDYDTDVDKAHALMLEAAEANARVLAVPKPAANLEGFGDNALTLSLRAYIEDIEHRVAITSELNMAINRKFREAGIVIAFAQCDLRLDAGRPLRVKLEDPGRAKSRDSDGDSPTGR
jgi:potassium efflux system protein